jgi:cardiolipin synthase
MRMGYRCPSRENVPKEFQQFEAGAIGVSLGAGYTWGMEVASRPLPHWFNAGDTMFPAMLAAIAGAVATVAFETYIFADDALGRRFRAALIAAAQRGVRVRVLVDALGSFSLPGGYWAELETAGAEVRWFNPIQLRRLGIRNHRKLLVCDGRTAFIGGFNVASTYEGDGVARGWRDLGVSVGGALAAQLEASFGRMMALADLRHKRFPRLRQTAAKRTLIGESEHLLLSGPGRGASPIQRSLQRDLKRAQRVRIIVPYFLPTWRLRRSLQQVARRGGRVELILPGKSDIAVSQLAARSFYQRLLRAGVAVHEYQPQILHAKLFIVDDAVYLGSANLDRRSLQLNYELMVRFTDPALLAQADAEFEAVLAHCRVIEPREWKRSRSWWTRVKERWAHFLLARVDPYIAMRQWRRLPD